ncbi:hypothetical protein DOTSEDRAFT_73606 [Dothistroma septosporum NZE10]|uniref:Uncharacterized protein n=1 Tax=Dothistroma septosporum (strain NZE10 / CBS 128990) TaxID=675120 RepID=N1PGK4_DOTSN|nr:hypothetical protein DOTSEDRAFT_73606 [Dothistroma septosporum NZE10]
MSHELSWSFRDIDNMLYSMSIPDRDFGSRGQEQRLGQLKERLDPSKQKGSPRQQLSQSDTDRI